MSAPALQVRSLHARYRLRHGEERTRERLDRVLSSVVGEGLDAALARAGVAADEEICIRAVRAPVRLRLAASDDAVCAAWSSAIVAAIDAAAAQRGRDVVRYPSRRHALADLVVAAGRGDYDRAWAWRRLGLWRGGDSPTAEGAAEALVDALAGEPDAVVPTLAAAAERGGLAALVALLTEGHWTLLATVALHAAGASPASAADVLTGAADLSTADPAANAAATTRPPEPRRDLASSERLAAAAADVSRRSAIARALASGGAAAAPRLGSAPATRAALGVLAVLEDDPAAFSSRPAHAAALARAVSQSFAALGREPARTRDEDVRSADRDERARSADREERARSADGDAPAEAQQRTPAPGAPADAPQHASSAADTEPKSETAARADLDAVAGEPGRPAPSSAVPEGEDDPAELPAAGRQRATTRFGGLLFLLRVVGALELPLELPPALAERRFRWVLHRLALLLQPLDPDDPAALAFAGLPPDAEPPSADEEPATDDELEALDSLAGQIVDALRDLLDDPDAERERILDFVCRRRAEVRADPGWIELHFAVDDVSTELRRVGLDLDLGFLPWLGAVVRFVYA